MLVIISPAKTLDMESRVESQISSLPVFLDKSKRLVSALKKKKASGLSKLMGISPKLGQLNFERYQEWTAPYIIDKSRQAVFAFRGEVFTGLNIDSFNDKELSYTQDHLRILSGLYGILRPMDLIMAYRLEMGTKITLGKNKNLYSFWGDHITHQLNKIISEQNDPFLINLASNEYFKSINQKKLKGQIITPVFKDYKNDSYKVISFFAKKARGQMSNFILQNKIAHPDEIKLFEKDGYYYNDEQSTSTIFTFTRG